MDKIRQLVGNLDKWLQHKENCETAEYPFDITKCNCGLQDILFHIETEISRKEGEEWGVVHIRNYF